ncbi:MAG: ABC transporter permease, partial [Gammaproteobacteria bacterium]|nr:ABC transporter permease [Gammaproteobacteria bacterium]
MILLSVYDLSLAAGLILLLALLSFRMKLNIEKQLVVAAIRTAVQLVLI